MLGSYGPNGTAHVAQTPLEEAPSGMLARGHYTVKSKFVDDYNESFLEWEWYPRARHLEYCRFVQLRNLSFFTCIGLLISRRSGQRRGLTRLRMIRELE
jgi:hypothetical protein